jgi:hypothetical protein
MKADSDTIAAVSSASTPAFAPALAAAASPLAPDDFKFDPEALNAPLELPPLMGPVHHAAEVLVGLQTHGVVRVAPCYQDISSIMQDVDVRSFQPTAFGHTYAMSLDYVNKNSELIDCFRCSCCCSSS